MCDQGHQDDQGAGRSRAEWKRDIEVWRQVKSDKHCFLCKADLAWTGALRLCLGGVVSQ